MFRRCQTTLCCKKIIVVLRPACPPLEHQWIPIPPRPCLPEPCGGCACPPIPCPCPPPGPDIHTHDFWFRKTDENGAPLPGAVFSLSGGGAPAGTATSDQNGLVFFGGLRPGRYTLTEAAPPLGFVADGTRRTVLVQHGGTITIDGTPAAMFVSRNVRQQQVTPPGVQQIHAGAAFVLGLATAGCTVYVQWPGGGQSQAVADVSGSFTIAVPGGTTLLAGQTVVLWQQCPGGAASPPAVVAVLP